MKSVLRERIHRLQWKSPSVIMYRPMVNGVLRNDHPTLLAVTYNYSARDGNRII